MATAKEPERASVVKFLSSLPPDVQETVQALRNVQVECDVVRADFMKESKQLEDKYRVLYEPLFKRRSHLVMGGEQPEGLGAVPGFWLKVLKTPETVADHVTRRDEPILKYLVDIRSDKIEDSPGFKLVFQFAENPYLKPLTLEKRYFMQGEDETILEKTEGTEITWSEGKDPTFKVVSKKSSKSSSGPPKVIQKHSFFDFFSPPQFAKDEDNEDDRGEQMAEIAELLMEDDFEMGCYIKEVLIPSAVSLYTGEIADDDEDDDEDDDDEEDDEDSSDEFSDSDSD